MAEPLRSQRIDDMHLSELSVCQGSPWQQLVFPAATEQVTPTPRACTLEVIAHANLSSGVKLVAH